MELIYYIPLGFIPSLVWLFYYLKKDIHPEPRILIIEIFLLGMLSTFLALFFQYAFITSAVFKNIIVSGGFFFWAILAFTEEAAKFIFVYLKIKKEKEFEELTDAIEYMIIGGLGFAALENILYLSQLLPYQTAAAFNLIILRFLGATFIHALSSGILGFFWALSIKYQRYKKFNFLSGFLAATLLHTAFNYSIIIKRPELTIVLIIFSAVILNLFFKRLKNIDNG